MDIIDFNNQSQWNNILNNSLANEKAIAVFKHSDTCSISTMALSRLQRNWKFTTDEVPFHLLEVKKYRPISNQIATDLNIQHESPQLFIIKDGKCIYTASHGNIDIKEIEAVI
jgi:bacillithiol system protein YtxJ